MVLRFGLLDATTTTTGGKMSMTLNPESLEKALAAMGKKTLDSRLPYSADDYDLIAKAITAYLEAEAEAGRMRWAYGLAATVENEPTMLLSKPMELDESPHKD
jgi:hypothetical protein